MSLLPAREYTQRPANCYISCGLSVDALLRVTNMAINSTKSDESLRTPLLEGQNDRLSPSQSAALIMCSCLDIIHGHITSRLANGGMSTQHKRDMSSLVQDYSSHGEAIPVTAASSRRNKTQSDNHSDLDASDDSSSDGDAGRDSHSNIDDDEDKLSNTVRHSLWTALEEQRLKAYVKEGKPWKWIFQQFPHRTQSSTHSSIHASAQRRGTLEERIVGFRFSRDSKDYQFDFTS
jgi:hypothetical protein